MSGKSALPSGAVPISVAAQLLGLTTDRIGQLVRGGHAISPGRGLVNLPSLLRGYVAQLRAAASRPASAALARDQKAKAELITEGMALRRAELIERAAAEEAVRVVVEVAVEHVRSLTRPGAAALKGVSPDLADRFLEEARAAADKIEAAQTVAFAALRSGNFEEIER